MPVTMLGDRGTKKAQLSPPSGGDKPKAHVNKNEMKSVISPLE